MPDSSSEANNAPGGSETISDGLGSSSRKARPRPRNPFFVVLVVLVVILVAGGGYAAWTYAHPSGSGIVCHTHSPTSSSLTPRSKAASPVANPEPAKVVSRTHSGSSLIQVVAAENFWGSIVTQIGGNDTSVLSIITDPNADPHEYTENNSDVTAIADAQYVIVNGVGYDTWALQAIAANPNPNRVVLNVGNINGVPIGGNPHMWYNPAFVNLTARTILANLTSIAPQDASYFQQNFNAINASLNSDIFEEENNIRSQFAGTEVAATESIFVYMANALRLNLVSPASFMDAVAEGNDPPEQSVSEFEDQLESGNVSVLVYNEQTVTPLTSEMKTIAQTCGVAVVGVTETIQPPNYSFQVWMQSELIYVQNGLNSNALGQ